MNIQIFGTKKSFDTKKAQRWFKERRIKFQFIDLKEKEMSKGELRSGANRPQRPRRDRGLRPRGLEYVGVAPPTTTHEPSPTAREPVTNDVACFQYALHIIGNRRYER